ncbi:hypothetical protein A7C99_5382 [Trichophyton rubrum]|uniref:DUF4396 domain-containing protein n=1 Tax=Trichophyton rubrum TaxID=5551 RepID=A0A178ET19_TRIRU|nr:hypothetical protein A7C99_5382 [Trichophyton rubrum]
MSFCVVLPTRLLWTGQLPRGTSLSHKFRYAIPASLTKIRSAHHCANSQKSDEPILSLGFWSSKPTWKRAGVNTFRCLIGCSLGDFSAMWFLQSCYPGIGTGLIMGIAMASGLTSSMLLETVLLRLGRDQLSWKAAAKTAAGMSLVSMLGMETVQNLVDYHLTSGVVAFDDPSFWLAAAASAGAGFLAPLPYNYTRLRNEKKASRENDSEAELHFFNLLHARILVFLPLRQVLTVTGVAKEPLARRRRPLPARGLPRSLALSSASAPNAYFV